jgi:D-alanyl-D-alanine carboxypeptidase
VTRFPKMHGARPAVTAAVAASAAAAALLAAYPALVPAHAAAAHAPASYERAQLQHDVQAIRGLGVTGVAAEVDGGRLTARSGQAELGSGQPVPYGGYFRIGSATKTFVATVILQLAAERKLSLGDTVARWLPGVVRGDGNDGRRITIRELLQHTSGLYSYDDDLPQFATAPGYRANRLRSATPAQLVAIAMRHRPYFPPGTSFHYSNTGYVLAGMIIQKVTGRSWAQEVRDQIIEPLALRHTLAPGAWPLLPPPHAHGYQQFSTRAPLTDVTVINPTWADAAGSMISTTGDLDRFFRALVTGRLLSPVQLAAMETTVPAIGVGGLFARYGLGLAWQALPCGGGYWTHGGDFSGFSTWDGVTPDGRHSAVVVSSAELSPVGQANPNLREHQLAVQLVGHALCATAR